MRCLFFLLILLIACEPEGATPFTVLGRRAESEALGQDQTLVLDFSRELDPRIAETAILVRDDKGASVPVHLEARGRELWISPAHASHRWPDVGFLDVHVLHPAPGLPIKSLLGEELSSPFCTRVPLCAALESAPLRLLADDLGQDAATGERMILADPDAPALAFQFDAAIDETSLGAGIQLIAITRRTRSDVSFRRDPKDWRRLLLPRHHRGQAVFVSGERYQVRITKHLRSLDGRRAPSGQRVDFRVGKTAPDRPRTLVFEFADAADLDPTSEARAQIQRDHWEPQPIRDAAYPTYAEEDLIALGEDDALLHAAFGAGPARLQILVPASVLGDEPALLHSLALRAAKPIPTATELRDFELSIGGLLASESGLSARFHANQAEGHAQRRIPLAGGSRSLIVGPSDDGLNDAAPVLLIPFGTPYLYEPTGAGLLIDISHGGVRLPPDIASREGGEDFARRGIELVGLAPPSGHDGQSPRGFVIGQRDEALGQPLSFLPAFALETERFPTLISRWVLAEGANAPEFFLEGRELEANGLTAGDLELGFEGGHPLIDALGRLIEDADGRPLCSPLEGRRGYSPLPPARGATAVRVRIRISPRLLLNERGAEPREVSHVFLRYRERPEALRPSTER